MTIEIPGTPPTTTQQQHRVIVVHGRPKFIPGKQVEKTRRYFRNALLPYAGKTIDGPVAVTTIWSYPYRTSERKKITEKKRVLPKDTRPDADNLMKALLDEIVAAGILPDDNAIATLTTYKCWAADPGITINIEPINGDDFEKEINELKGHTA